MTFLISIAAILIGFSVVGMIGNYYYIVYYALFLVAVLSLILQVRKRKSEEFIAEYVLMEVKTISAVGIISSILFHSFKLQSRIYFDFVLVFYGFILYIVIYNAIDIHFLKLNKQKEQDASRN